MAVARIKLLPKQAEFLQSKARFTGYVAGYGAGKTYAGAVKTIIKMIENRYNVAYYLPTYLLIRDIAVPRFKEILMDLGIPAVVNYSLSEIFTSYGSIKLRSFDKPERIIGYEVGYSLIDEADTIPVVKMDDVFKRVIARNRAKASGINQTDVVSTPEGYGWLYNFFVKKADVNKRLIRASTFENPFLPTGYIDALKDTYDEKHLRAYLHGEFVNLEGEGVFYAFDRERHTTAKTIADFDLLHVGLDFNIGNMTAIVYGKEGETYYAVDELTGLHDTLQMAQALKELLKGRRFYVYPDASGSGRSTAAGKSDFDVLRREGIRVRALTRNPSVSARMAVANKLLETDRLFVNVERCASFTDALEKLVWKAGNQIDKGSGFDHAADAGTYPLYFIERDKLSRISKHKAYHV